MSAKPATPSITELESAVGNLIRSRHPYAYQTGKWGLVVAVVPCRGKDMWLIKWPGGITDVWNPVDPSAAYEWRAK
jgi:hypothetical protein